MPTIDLGKVAYLAYCTYSDGKSLISGETLPSWEDQSEEIRAAWRATADGVKMFLDTTAKPDPHR